MTSSRYSAALRMAAVAVRIVFCLAPATVPTGVLELVLVTKVLTSSSEIPRDAAETGSTCTRTANFCEPNTCTCAMRAIAKSAGQRDLAIVVDRRQRQRRRHQAEHDDGRIARIDLTKGRRNRHFDGSLRAATVSAVCTSSAAPSILRLRSNWIVIEVMPSERNRGQRGNARNCRKLPLDLAPQPSAHGFRARPRKVAVIWMVGKSTAGSAATDSRR